MSLDPLPLAAPVRNACAVLACVQRLPADISDQLEHREGIDNLLGVTARLKVSLDARWDAGDARREGPPTVWDQFDSRFHFVEHADPEIRDGLLRLAAGAIWLSGYAMDLTMPAEWREVGVQRLREGLHLLLPSLIEADRAIAMKHIPEGTELGELAGAVDGLCYFPERGYFAVNFGEATNQGVYRLNRYETPVTYPHQQRPNHREEIARRCGEIRPDAIPDLDPLVRELYEATVDAFRECSLAVGFAPFFATPTSETRGERHAAEYDAVVPCLHRALARAESAILAARTVVASGSPDEFHAVLEEVRKAARWMPLDRSGFDYVATREYDWPWFRSDPLARLSEHARWVNVHIAPPVTPLGQTTPPQADANDEFAVFKRNLRGADIRAPKAFALLVRLADHDGWLSGPDADLVYRGDAVSAIKRSALKKKLKAIGWLIHQQNGGIRLAPIPTSPKPRPE